ncbi:TetR/AcrR family transcriptional regulator [Cohnella rhizosphaerae]|uniref:TetR/AcrR family transcriptional regulator n=1 Tax=Cohnella rhizosphaerae TaxID=1457232 RepID=A0A9X4QS28_9BACL|nr:TetR/AcrR family transcriptional regulator [Cohnella rhizosphaerae]MDG0809170.1 TetR/AcrR family transcriptional regulator [Cohnella rhizosphaerae]
MEDTRTDPRVLRTRQLIRDAFNALIPNKDIKDITIGDITKRATINRATFYAHYADKYELMEDALSQLFKDSVMQKLSCHAELNRETLTGIIVTLCEFHESFSRQCARSYEAMSPYIESKLSKLLKDVFGHLLRPKNGMDDGAARTMSGVLSWIAYGMTKDWNKDGRKVPPERLAEQAIAALSAAAREIDGAGLPV